MGRASRDKAMRRRIRQDITARSRAGYDARMAEPEMQAAIAALEADTEARDLMGGALEAQSKRLYRAGWRIRDYGSDGLGIWDHRAGLRIIHSVARQADGQVWGHTSVSRRDNTMPGWYEVRDAHRLIYPDHAGIIVVPPAAEHYSEAEVHHVWTCLSRADVLPDFRFMGAV